MQQIFPVKQHQHEPDHERARNINQKRRQRKSPVVMLVNSEGDQISGQGTNAAAGEHEKGSNQQSTDFSAPDFIAPDFSPETGKLSA
jgi:hypothetical protein